MDIKQLQFTKLPTLEALNDLIELSPQWLLIFGDVRFFENSQLFSILKEAFPNAELTGCSTAGEIYDESVHNDSLIITAIRFDKPNFKVVETQIESMLDSEQAGIHLAQQFSLDGLNDVLVFAQGVKINGSALIDGMIDILPKNVKISGGLAGDNGSFKQTWVLSNQGISDQKIVAIGFYNQSQIFKYANFGGWQPFGLTRKITKSIDNILYELDGEPALDVYCRYLGDYAKGLPASGLLFPFEMLEENHHETGLVRTILGINEENGSLILAGDIIPNGFLRLMHSSTNDLVNGAEQAGLIIGDVGQNKALAILVSCIGRKIVMGDRVDEEIEVIADVLSQNGILTGFYSHGEISPNLNNNLCQLHNQTMTITCIQE